MITDHEIERQLRHPDPQDACKGLVNKALDAGGNDNVTCIVVDIAGKMKRKQKKKSGGTSKFVAITVAILLLLAIAGAAFGFNAWVHNSAYLAEQNGKIAVYKGMPTSYGPFSYSELDQVTDVNLSDITTPSLADRIKTKQIVCSSLGEAWDLVNGYKDDIDKDKQKKEQEQKKSDSSSSSSANKNSSNSSASNSNSQNNNSSTNTTQQ